MRIYNFKKQKSLSRYQQVLAMRENASVKQKSTRRSTYGRTTHLMLILFAIIIFCLGFMTCSFFSKADNISEAEPRFKYITNIEVVTGDTLWDIAGRYISEEYRNRYEYIDEVCQINNLSNWHVEAGDYLVVPYFAGEYK